MNELQTQTRQLPTSLEDLSKFVLVGREKLNAVRAEIRAIKAVGLAKEVHEQKLAEAQEIAEAVLDAETKLGELTAKMEKAQGFASIRPNGGENVKTKAEQLKEIGITHAERFETLAKHPETVEQAKADARAEGRIVTRADVLNRIVMPKKNPSIKEVIKQAHEEHEQFKQAKGEAVVSFKDAQEDKRNQDLVNTDTKIKIQKALTAVSDLDFLPVSEIEEMINSFSEMDKTSMQNRLRNAIKTLVHISNKIGG